MQDKILQNIIDTKKYLEVTDSQYFNKKNMVEMLDYAIENWSKNKIDALEFLSNKEQELITKGLLIDENRNDNEGYFKSLLQLVKLDNQNIGAIWKKNDKDKSNGSEIANNINKFNPVTVIARNSLFALIRMNFFGLATILTNPKSKETGVYTKIENLIFDIGGSKDFLTESIKYGNSKKILFNKKLKDDLKAGRISKDSKISLGELGEAIAIATIIASASAFLIKIWDWIEKAGLDKLIDKAPSKDKPKEPLEPKAPDNQTNTPDNQTKTPDNQINISDNQTNNISNDGNNKNDGVITDEDKKKKTQKIILFTAIGLTVVGGGFALYKYLGKKNISETKPKLSGITFN